MKTSFSLLAAASFLGSGCEQKPELIAEQKQKYEMQAMAAHVQVKAGAILSHFPPTDTSIRVEHKTPRKENYVIIHRNNDGSYAGMDIYSSHLNEGRVDGEFSASDKEQNDGKMDDIVSTYGGDNILEGPLSNQKKALMILETITREDILRAATQAAQNQ